MATVDPDICTPANPCPHCGHNLNAAFGWETEETPEPGDFSICAYCGGIFIFGDDLKLREPQGDEFREIAGDQKIITAQKMLAAYRKK